MRKNYMTTGDVILETLSIFAVVTYLMLQIYYVIKYDTTAVTVLYHVIPLLLVYAGISLLERNPEYLNGWNSEPLKGRVRDLAVRMLRVCKALLICGIVIPAFGDLLELTINAAYSLIVMLAVLVTIGYFMYRIYEENKKDHP